MIYHRAFTKSVAIQLLLESNFPLVFGVSIIVNSATDKEIAKFRRDEGGQQHMGPYVSVSHVPTLPMRKRKKWPATPRVSAV